MIKTYRSKYFAQNIYLSPEKFPSFDEIFSINRYGKFLFFKTPEHMIYSHLGMSGTWLIVDDVLSAKAKHTHLSFTLENKKGKLSRIDYVDPRRFGKVKALEYDEHEFKMSQLFPDPSTKKFTLKSLKLALGKYPERLIKVTLLDQNLFPGVGNYIASEICAHAGILPNRKVKTLTDLDIKNIFKSFKKVINSSVKSKGTTFSGGYQDAHGNEGEGVKNLIVFYQSICQKCKHTEVVKTFLAQRGTYHCPNCQK